MAVLLEIGDGELAPGLWGPIRDGVTGPDVMQPGDDAIGARAIRGEQEPVDPPRGVPAAAVPAHLDQPRPDLRRRCVDCDGMCRNSHRVTGEPIARQPPMAFLSRRTPGTPEPL
jgi:hypothetical protein